MNNYKRYVAWQSGGLTFLAKWKIFMPKDINLFCTCSTLKKCNYKNYRITYDFIDFVFFTFRTQRLAELNLGENLGI